MNIAQEEDVGTAQAKPSLVDRVASAIYETFEGTPRYAQLQMNCLLAKELAIAAIEAMREPDDAMVEAAWLAVKNASPEDRMASCLMPAREAHAKKFRHRHAAAIDAALSQGAQAPVLNTPHD